MNTEEIQDKNVAGIKHNNSDKIIPSKNILFYSCLEPKDLENGLGHDEWIKRFEQKKKRYFPNGD